MSGYGKVKRQRGEGTSNRSPYAVPGGTPKQNDPDNSQNGGQEELRSSLIGSVVTAAATPLRAAAGLIGKVSMFGGYFGASPSSQQPAQAQQKPASPTVSSRDKEESDGFAVVLDGTDDERPPVVSRHKPVANGDHSTPTDTLAAFKAFPGTGGSGPNTASPNQTTPYDGVLALLRSGPLAKGTPDLPMPRSRQPLQLPSRKEDGTKAAAPGSSAGGGSSLLFRGNTPASGVKQYNNPIYDASGGGTPGTNNATRTQVRTEIGAGATKKYTASRLGPFAAAGATGAGTSKAAAGPSRLAIASTAAAQQQPQEPPAGSTPLAWTPMRSNMAGSGLKRKAETETPTDLEGGSISILDAQRRIRQRSGASLASATAERRSWRAGRTPYRSGTAGFQFASTPGGGALTSGFSPVPLTGLSAAAAGGTSTPTLAIGTTTINATNDQGATPTPPGGMKTTTDTARRILETLEALDETLASAAKKEKKEAEKKKAQQQASPPPPTGSIGAMMPKEKQQEKSKGVTFGGVSFAASPSPSNQTKKATGDFSFNVTKTVAAAPVAAPTPSLGLKPAAATETADEEEPETLGVVSKKKQQQQKKPSALAPLVLESKPSPPSAQETTPKSAGTPKYEFGTSPRDPTALQRVAAAVKAAEGSPAMVPSPVFSFGKAKKPATPKSDTTTTPGKASVTPAFVASPLGGVVVSPNTIAEANKTAEKAAKSPLPEVRFDSDTEEQPVIPKTSTSAEKPKPAPAPVATVASGWGSDFLAANKSVASKATEAAEKEIQEKSGFGAPPKPATTPPVFSFGAPSSSEPAASSAPAPVFGIYNSASAPTFAFGAPASTAAATTEASPAVPAFLLSSTTAAPGAAPVVEKPVKEPEKPATFAFGAPPGSSAAATTTTTAPAASGWGSDFLNKNKAAAGDAQKAAQEEIEKSNAGFGSAPAGSAAAPSISFGVTPAAASAPSFGFGAAPSTTAIGGSEPATATSAPALSFGATPSGTAPGGSTFTFGGAPAVASQATVAAASSAAAVSSFGFGGASSTSAPAVAASTGFAFGASSSAAPSTFAFGASAPAASSGSAATFSFGAGAAASGSTFVFGASAPAAAPAAPVASTPAPSTFAFGAQASSQPAFGAPSAPAAASTGFAFGASAATPASPAPSTFAFGASAPSAPAATPSLAGFGTQQPPAPASGGFGFGATASQQQPSPAAFGGFGAPSQPPAVAPGGGFSGFGGAPQQQQQQQPFGAPQQPAFGGFGAPQAPTFGAPQPGAFGAPSQPPGQMIPNNPFGGAAPAGFNMGSSGSQPSEGRRKLRAKRPGRK